MGHSSSQASPYPVTNDELRHAPHNFYLVLGAPPLRFTRDPIRGPLIYEVEVEHDSGAPQVEHAATLDLSCAVPRRQKFELLGTSAAAAAFLSDARTSRTAPSGRGGLALSFQLAATAPPKRVRVCTHVSIEYNAGEGLRFAAASGAGSSDSSHHRRRSNSKSRDGHGSTSPPTCIYNTTNTAGRTKIVTAADVFPAQLRPAAYTGVPCQPPSSSPSTYTGSAATTTAAVQRVTYAPIVIEVDVGEVLDPIQNGRVGPSTTGAATSTTNSRPAQGNRADSNHTPPPAAAATATAGLSASSLTTSPSTSPLPAGASATMTATAPSAVAPVKKRVLHYTLLELPADASDYAAANATASTTTMTAAGRREGNKAAAAPLTCKVLKQLLQVGSEVYELEDVFDVGRDEDVRDYVVEASEEEDLCVICLTNTKDTTILPCRHMCLCNECATHLRLSNNKCPLCRGNIDRVMTL